jgi:large subunit ribosomal protein L3
VPIDKCGFKSKLVNFMFLTSKNIFMSGMMATKIGMTRIFQDNGEIIPVTLIKTEANEVIQVKNIEKDKYQALVLGFNKLKVARKTRKYKFVKEFNGVDDKYKKGDFVNIDLFQEGEMITISAISKGKGFAGVIKRHNFSSGPETHGSHGHREGGSIGARAKPGRVCKGKRMPGHMGDKLVTLKGKIIEINKEKGLIAIKGPIPGANNSLIVLKKINLK